MNLLSLIGNTPIVPLRLLAAPEGGAIYAKLEAMNPGGSVWGQNEACRVCENASRNQG